ncbi:MAG: DegV family protein [Lachnospiraceae bacterium]|nr:DegV family protein [Lachnospiraceae bacterium]
MSKYILSCCSTADMSEEFFYERNINYVCFHYEVDGVEYSDDLGKSMSFEEFYKKMEQGAMTKTSQVNADEYINYFGKFLDEGYDILHVCLSSGISGSYNSAMIAKSDLEEKYPERKIYVVDSLNASSGFGLLMDELADLRDAGKNIDELNEWIEQNKLYYNAWVLTTDLTYLVRGGRVSKAAGVFGTALNICPIIEVNVEGKLLSRDKVRTKKKAIKELVAKMENLAENGTEYSGKCFISNSACLEDAQAVASLIKEKFPNVKEVVISDIGTTIGSHTGPGTVALFFKGKERIN